MIKGPLEEPQAVRGGIEISLSSPSVTPPGLTGQSCPPEAACNEQRQGVEGYSEKKRKEKGHHHVIGVAELRGREERKGKGNLRSGQSRSESRRRRRRRRSGEESEPPVERSSQGVGEEPERRQSKAVYYPFILSKGSSTTTVAIQRSSTPPRARVLSKSPFWSGPIPAGKRPRGGSPQQKNKGLKKRRQQERARTFGWKFHDGKRWR